MTQPSLSQSPVPFGSSASANGFNGHRQMPDVPRFLYHGTSTRFLAQIRERGLQPRQVSGNGWQKLPETSETPGQPITHENAIYLSCSINDLGPLRYANLRQLYDHIDIARNKSTNPIPAPLVLQIDMEKLDSSLFFPDQDYLATVLWSSKTQQFLSQAEPAPIALAIAKTKMEKFHHLWMDSLTESEAHSIAFLGTVRPSAITSYLVAQELDEEFEHHLVREYDADLAAHSATFDEMFQRRGQPFHVEEMAAKG
jgi:hypothetical protein